jgi:hypothetical protein
MIFYKKKKTHIYTFTYFPNRRCRCWENIHKFYAIHVAILYETNAIYVDPLKPKIMKLTYTYEVAFNINGTIIHFALVIPLNKNYNDHSNH